ncbi:MULTISPECIES: LexA family protein [Halobacteriovorax]|nr:MULTISPECIES: S24 family peptidase [Halobacteriovorax]
MNTHKKLPVANCGLFGISEDHIENYQSLDERFVQNRSATFFFEAQGDSMEPLIIPGDVLVIDRSLEVKSGRVAIVYLDGEFLCKRLIKQDGRVILRSHNPLHRDITITDEMDFLVWGPIVAVARDMKEL